MTHKRCVLLIVVLFGPLATLYGLLTPLWEAPDEPSHFLYVKHVAQYWRPPHSTVKQTGRFFEDGYVTSLYEWHHPALYYAINGAVLAAVRAIAPAMVPEGFPPVNPLVPNAPSPHLLLPDTLTPFKWANHHLGPLILRLVSIGLAMGTLLVGFCTAQLAMPNRPAFALAVMGWMAFLPQFTYLSATINNDNLANLVSSATILILLFILFASDADHLELPMLLAGILLAVALLTKLTLIFLFPLAAGVWLVVTIRRRSLRLAVRYALLTVLPVLLLVGTYYVVFPEARAALEANSQSLQVNPEFVTIDYIKRIFLLLPSTFWGRFGWANVPIPESFVQVLGLFTIGGLAITVGFFLRDLRRREFKSRDLQVTLFLLAAVGLNFAAFLRFNLTIFQPQGRFLFSILGPLLILSLLGLWRLVPCSRENPLAGLLVGSMLLVNVYALTQVLYPAYYHRPLPSAFQNTSSEPVGETRADMTHGQTFTAHYDNLSRIDLMLATFARDNQYPVVFHLKRAPDSPEDLVTVTFDASDVVDNAYRSFTFDPIPDSAGHTFYFYLESPQSVPDDAITIWFNPENPYPSGTRFKNHQPANGDLRFIAISTP